MSSELSREEALVALDRRVAELEERYYEVYAWQGKASGRFIALEGKAALTGTAGTGGGEGEKADGLKWIHMPDHETITGHLRGKIASLESRLAAAEKRAEGAESRAMSAEHEVEAAKRSERVALSLNDSLARERDALKAELAEAKKAVKTEYHRGYDDYRRDLDAALARVKELEAKLATIRDAAGAQP